MCSCDRSPPSHPPAPAAGLLPALGDHPPPTSHPPLSPNCPPRPPLCSSRSQGKVKQTLKPGDYPDDANMCTHFRKPWKKGAKVTSRDKVYELTGCHIMPIQSIPSDYVICSEWASEPMEQLPPYTRRRHRPYKYEFLGAEFWPWTTLRAKLEAEKYGTECRPEAFPDWTPMRPRDPPPPPPPSPTEATRKDDESKGTCTPLTEGMNPQRRARLLLEAGWHPNPWKKLWGATINDNPIIQCENCNCYVLPPVPDLLYLTAHHEKSSCFKDRGCYYSSYSSKKWRPPTASSCNSDYGRFHWRPNAGPPVDQSYCRPPPNWWVTEIRPPYIPPPPDYDLLTPSVGAPPKHSIYEINSISRVGSQWTP